MIAYHASHEQFSPSELLALALLAEQAGFQAIHSSDHFQPWSERQGQSGFSFAWLGAAMQATTLPFGMICAPGPRYHPAVIAQATATLAEMFPNRFWLELGSGEAINEKITGAVWPTKDERNQRLLESAHIIRKLLQGDTVTHSGDVTVREAKLYTRPPYSPKLIGAAITEKTASWIGTWADGMITVSRSPEELRPILDAFKNNGGAGKPVYLKVQLSYARLEKNAVAGAYDQWRTNILPPNVVSDLWKVSQFDELGEYIKPEDLKSQVNISSNPQQHIQWLQQYLDLGVDHLILHNVNRDQKTFLEDFGKQVLPALRTI